MRLLPALLCLAALCASGPAAPQAWPDRPVRLLVGFPAGGPPDQMARLLATRLAGPLGQPVIVENRPGASGMLAAGAVAHAEPDGHTLLLGVAANLAVAPAAMRQPPYDPRTAFTPVIEIARGPYLWLVRADAPARSLQEFVDWARREPGRLNFASPGPGSAHHLATLRLARATGVDMVHVPYRSSLYVPLLAGEVQATFDSMPGPLPPIEAGRVRALAVSGPRRLPALPDVPTLAEQGVRDADAQWWWGIVGPAGMPRAVVARLNAEVARALGAPDVAATLARWSIEPSAGTPEAFGGWIAQESRRWSEAVAAGGGPVD